MLFDTQVLTFAGIALVLTLTPGADTMIVIRNVMQDRKKAGVYTTFGVCSGLLFHAIFSALGLSLIILKSAQLFEIVKFAGAAYLTFLGLQSFLKVYRHSKEKKSETPQVKESISGKEQNGMTYFANGLFTNILNPKVALFYLAFLPQFIGPADQVFSKSIILAAIHLIFGLIWLILVSHLVEKMKAIFTGSKFKIIMESISGFVLVGLGIKLALEKR